MMKQKVNKGPSLGDTHDTLTKQMSEDEVKEFNTKVR